MTTRSRSSRLADALVALLVVGGLVVIALAAITRREEPPAPHAAPYPGGDAAGITVVRMAAGS